MGKKVAQRGQVTCVDVREPEVWFGVGAMDLFESGWSNRVMYVIAMINFFFKLFSSSWPDPQDMFLHVCTHVPLIVEFC